MPTSDLLLATPFILCIPIVFASLFLLLTTLRFLSLGKHVHFSQVVDIFIFHRKFRILFDYLVMIHWLHAYYIVLRCLPIVNILVFYPQ